MTTVNTAHTSADFLDQLSQPVVEDADPELDKEDLLLQMVKHALYALNEIQIFASIGRVDGALNEVNDALAILLPLKDKYDEQIKIMEVLSGNTDMVVGDNYV